MTKSIKELHKQGLDFIKGDKLKVLGRVYEQDWFTAPPETWYEGGELIAAAPRKVDPKSPPKFKGMIEVIFKNGNSMVYDHSLVCWTDPTIAYWRPYLHWQAPAPARPSKSQSFLQAMNSEVQWRINYMLQPITPYWRYLTPSATTQKLTQERNRITKELKDSIKADYDKARKELRKCKS